MTADAHCIGRRSQQRRRPLVITDAIGITFILASRSARNCQPARPSQIFSSLLAWILLTCQAPLQLCPQGDMELEEELVRCRLFVECKPCDKSLVLEQEFEWGP